MQILFNSGLLPSDIGNGTGKTAWGGNYQVTAASIARTSGTPQIALEIVITNVPAKACQLLTQELANQTLPNVSSGCTELTAPYNFVAYFG